MIYCGVCGQGFHETKFEEYRNHECDTTAHELRQKLEQLTNDPYADHQIQTKN